MKYNKLLSLVFVLVLALAACSPAQLTSAPATSVPTALPETNINTGSDFPAGKFIMTDTPGSGLTFNPDGTFLAFSGDYILARGTYKAQGNVFTETSNNAGCSTNVSFNYTYDGKNLTFNYIGNPDDDMECGGRYNGFNNVTYILSN